MKILEEKYPLGTLKYQKSDGRYIDKNFYENLKILASRIVDDMTFMIICYSSTLEVGTGKSVLMTQVGEAWTDIINRMHGLNLTFTKRNIVWRPKDLIERSFQVPKYSCILVDEWEDAHYWSELGMTLRQFFRKCRQLNLFIILIIPNFFQMPISYAIGRSIFAIDVKFQRDFQRGFYDFYDFEKKRELYIKGKKTHNYKVIKPSFNGRFFDGYGINREEYIKAKAADMRRMDEEGDVILKPETIKYREKLDVLWALYSKRNLIKEKGFCLDTISAIMGAAKKTVERWMVEGKKREIEKEKLENPPFSHASSLYYK